MAIRSRISRYKNILMAAVISILFCIEVQALSKVCRPGELSSLLSDAEKQEITQLTLTGSIDMRDLLTIREMPALRKLDMRKVQIGRFHAARPIWYEYTYFESNEIPAYLFALSAVEDIVLPETIKKIGEGAFAGSALRSIEVSGSSLNEIGNHAFKDCDRLESFVGRDGLRLIGDRCFEGCISLSSVSLPGVERIGIEAFSGTALAWVSLPSLSKSRDYAMAAMPNLKSTDAVGTSEGFLSHNPQLKNLTEGIPSLVPPYYLSESPQAYIPTSLNATSIIQEGAFSGNDITWMQLSPSVQKIENYAFYGMRNLEYIEARGMKGVIPVVDEETFHGLDQRNIELCVPEANAEVWRNTEGWRNFYITTIPESSVGEIFAESDIKISLEGNFLIVDSSREIQSLNIYTPAGVMLYNSTPSVTHVATDISAISNGSIIIVAVETNVGTHSQMIMR